MALLQLYGWLRHHHFPELIMAHYAIINQDNIVEQVIVGVDETVTKGDVGGSTAAWESYYESRPWYAGKTVRRCSYSGSFRKNYPAIGDTWDPVRNAFTPVQPFPSWTFNEATCRWDPPTAKPAGMWEWNEGTLSWVEVSP